MRPDEIKKQKEKKDVEIISSPFGPASMPKQAEQKPQEQPVVPDEENQKSPDLPVPPEEREEEDFGIPEPPAPAEIQQGRFAPSVWVKMGGYIINLDRVKYVIIGNNRINIFLSGETRIDIAVGYTSPYPLGLVSQVTFEKIRNFFERLVDTEIE